MIGVTTYPYTRSQREYLDDFQALCATTIDHPYMATTAFNRSSVPHDLLYGSNFDDDRLGPMKKWLSEQKLAFVPKDLVAAKNLKASGVRSEQVQVRHRQRTDAQPSRRARTRLPVPTLERFRAPRSSLGRHPVPAERSGWQGGCRPRAGGHGGW